MASIFDQLPQAGKSFMGPMMALNQNMGPLIKIMTNSGNRLAQENMKFMTESMKWQVGYFQQLSQLGQTSKMEEWLDTSAASSKHSPLLEYAQNVSNILLESFEDYSKWFERSLQEVSKEGKNMQEQFVKESKSLQDQFAKEGKTVQEQLTKANKTFQDKTKSFKG